MVNLVPSYFIEFPWTLFVLILNVLIWLPLFIRQRGSKYYVVFLVFSFSDIFSSFLLFSDMTISVLLYLNYNMAFLIEFARIKKMKFRVSTHILVQCILIIFQITNTAHEEYYLLTIVLLILSIYFLREFLIELGKHHRYNIFLLVFFAYFMLNSIKILNIAVNQIDHMMMFWIGTTFTTLIGTFFLVFKESDPRILIYNRSSIKEH